MKTIHLKNIDLNLLLVFDCIYRERNLTLTGEKLGRTQSAISHSLERLRGIFNDPLFVRTPKQMRPTARSEELILPIRDALETINSTLTPPQQLEPERLEKTFKISMSDYCEMVILPVLMAFLSQNAPGVKIEILSPATVEPQQGLESGIYDLVIGNKDLETGIYQQRLFEDRFVCMARENHGSIKRKISLDDYLRLLHIIFSPRGKNDRLVEEQLKNQGLKRNIALRVPDIMVIPGVLRKTPYIVTLPLKLAESFDTDQLRILEPPFELPALPIAQYWHEALHNDPAHSWLRKAIQDLI